MGSTLELVKALLAESTNVSVFKDLYGARDEDIKVDVLCSDAEITVLRVSHSNASFIIKQFTGTSAARLVQIEYRALEQRSQFQPGLVPQPHLLSEKHHCVVMDDFKAFVSLRAQLASGELSEATQHNLTSAVAILHSNGLGEKVNTVGSTFMNNPAAEALLKAKYVETFSNATVCRLSDRLGGAALSKLSSAEVLERVKLLHSRIVESKQCVIHGNLNEDNVFMREDSIKLLGNHYTQVGPCALDIGTLLAQYLATYHVHMLTEQDNDAHRQVAYRMIYASTSLVDGYLKELSGVFNEEQTKDFVSCVAGFAGVELVHWAVTQTNSHAAGAVLDTGVRLIDTYHRIFSAGMLVNIALMLTF